MKLKLLPPKNSAGFTVIELLIATAVFAVVLIVAQTSFLHIGHLFYKGISITQTQDTADHIFQDINGNFQTAPNVTSGSGGGYTYYCIGNTRYTYNLNREIDTNGQLDHSANGNFGILKDILQGTGGACAAPCSDTGSSNCPPGAGYKQLSNPVELLGDKMRVEQFNITQSTTTSNLYNVSIIIAYGDDNTLSYTVPSDLSTVACQGDATNNFCAVSRIDTAVYKGWHQ